MKNERFYLRNYKALYLNFFKIKPYSIILSFILVLQLSPLNSQTPEFERYTTKDGLITDEVYNMHQDKMGYLWIFSSLGTLKYNGSKFKPVFKNLSVKESFIYTMYENDKGQKWVANSNARIFEVRNDSAFLIHGIEDVTSILQKQVSEIFKLYVDDSLNIYVITKGYSYKLTKKGTRYFVHNLSESFKADSVMFSINDLGKEVFVLTNRKMINGLRYINRIKTKSYIEVLKGEKSSIMVNPIFHISVLNSYTFIRNLKKYDENYYFLFSNTFGILNKDNSLSFMKLKSLALNFTRDKYGHFWVACLNDGIYELNEKGKILNHYLENITVNDVLIDHQSGIWASTAGSGLYHCENTKGICFNNKDPFGAAICLTKIINKVLYVANTRGEIFSIANGLTRQIRRADNLEIYEIEKQKDKLITSNISGSEKLSQGKQYRVPLSFGLNPTYHRIISKNEDTLIVCARQLIIYVINDKIKKINYYSRKIMTFELYEGLLWIATDDGVYQLPPGFKHESKPHNGVLVYDTAILNQPDYLKGTLNATIVKIVKDKEKGLWFCSRGNGLYKLRNKQLKNYTMDKGLPDNIVNDLFLTEDGNAILSTNSGLYLSRTRTKNGDFDKWEKIHTGAVKSSVLYNGKIYIGTTEGLIILDYKDLGNNNKKIFFNLNSIAIDSKEVDAASFNGIKSDQRTLEFNFDLINFTKDKPSVRYNLTGLQTDSGYIENAHLRLNQLPPGSYSLTAYPNTPSGKLTGLTIPFFVEPAFWQTTVFKLLTTVSLVLLISLSIWLIIRRNRKKENARIKNEQLILEYKLIALKAQINPHFMSNCLSAIQDLIMNNNTDKATFYVAEFGLMVRQILDFSSKQLISLGEELDLLNIYIELEQLRFENKFSSKIQIEEGISLKETFLPPLIFNPIVENAIWHGLLPAQNQKRGELHIIVKKENNCLVLSIEDNGIGRDAEKKGISNNKSKSYGIKITEQRLSNINYLYNCTDGRIIYTDLHDMDRKPSGTRVAIYLPLNLMPVENEQN